MHTDGRILCPANSEHIGAVEVGYIPERLLDDARLSMKVLLAQNINAWAEVDRLHDKLMEKST
jgi:hypothetical protein